MPSGRPGRRRSSRRPGSASPRASRSRRRCGGRNRATSRCPALAGRCDQAWAEPNSGLRHCGGRGGGHRARRSFSLPWSSPRSGGGVLTRLRGDAGSPSPSRPGTPPRPPPAHRPGSRTSVPPPLRRPASPRRRRPPCRRLGLRSGDPGQRPHLRVGQPGRRELIPDHRQVPQRPRHPHMLPRRAAGHLALPRQPLRAAVHLPAGPAAARVEVAEQDQEPARRRSQVPGRLADLLLQPLQRHRDRIAGHRGRSARDRDGDRDRDGTCGDGARRFFVEHVFDSSSRIGQSRVRTGRR